MLRSEVAAATGLDADKPLPFLVDGRERPIEFHIVNRIGDASHIEMHKNTVPLELEKAEATIVGFHSSKHRGIFTPGDSNIVTFTFRHPTTCNRDISRSFNSR